MPKTKKQRGSDSDTSDSGPDDRNVPANKKAKTSDSKNSSYIVTGSGDNTEYSWDLGKMRFVKVRSFKGKTLVDVREFYEDGSGQMKPGKKGISLSVEQWRRLASLADEINEKI